MRKNKARTSRTFVSHEFPALYDENCEVLMLGSIPSPKSREQGFYYGHPQNRFWKVLASVLNEPHPTTIDEKRAMLVKHHIALWDVLDSCTIIGASDTSIEDVEPNDIASLLPSTSPANCAVKFETLVEAYKTILSM